MQKLDKTKYISGKNLGELALQKFCPRCFWLKRHVGDTPGGFPGIFSTIDSLTKKSTKRSFDSKSLPPGWLEINDIKEVLSVPKIKVDMDEHGGWILTGAIVPELLIKARNILDADIPEPAEKCIGICSWIEKYSEKMKNL